MSDYYADKLELLRDLFAAGEVTLEDGGVRLDGKRYPIVDDVIVLLDRERMPPALRLRLDHGGGGNADTPFAADIQSTFGDEWLSFPEIMPEHESEFRQYFDIVDLNDLRGKRVADLGCGIGRWSHFLRDTAGSLVLVDFSEAIFVARENLRGADNAVFLMADLLRLPLRADAVDFAFCLGVAHHLPVGALQAVRQLAAHTPRLLVYLYSALDGHPLHYRLMMQPVTLLRRMVCKIHNAVFRSVFTWIATLLLYLPLIAVGHLLRPFGLSRYVPLFDFYHGKSLARIRQDAYDRFFTRIEQRFSRGDIMSLRNEFSRIEISPGIPMWHFLCER